MKIFSAVFFLAFAAWAMGVVNVDLATKKIPNARLAAGLKLLLLAAGALFLNTLLGLYGSTTDFLNPVFYRLWLTHLLLAATAGVILWYSEIWPAGDAKFFMLAAAWLPLINPFIANFPVYLFLALLVNIFVAAALYSVGAFLTSGFMSATPADFFRKLGGDIRERMTALVTGSMTGRAAAAAYLLNMTLLFLLQQIVSIETRGLLGRVLSRPDLIYFFLFFLWDKVGRFFKSRLWAYAACALYLVYFAAGYFLFRDRMLAMVAMAALNVFKFSLLLFFGRAMLEFLMEKKDLIYLTPAEVEPGVILSSKFAEDLKRNPAFDGLFDDCFKDGLDEEQVAALKAWLARLPGEAKVEAVRGRAFAQWIFAGACLTLLLDKNLATLLR